MSSKRKATCYLQVNHPKIISRFFSRNFAGQKWHNIVKILGGKKQKTSNHVYPAKLSFRNEGKTKSSRPAKAKGVLHH